MFWTWNSWHIVETYLSYTKLGTVASKKGAVAANYAGDKKRCRQQKRDAGDNKKSCDKCVSLIFRHFVKRDRFALNTCVDFMIWCLYKSPISYNDCILSKVCCKDPYTEEVLLWVIFWHQVWCHLLHNYAIGCQL